MGHVIRRYKLSDILLFSSCVKLVIKWSCRLHCGRG